MVYQCHRRGYETLVKLYAQCPKMNTFNTGDLTDILYVGEMVE